VAFELNVANTSMVVVEGDDDSVTVAAVDVTCPLVGVNTSSRSTILKCVVDMFDPPLLRIASTSGGLVVQPLTATSCEVAVLVLLRFPTEFSPSSTLASWTNVSLEKLAEIGAVEFSGTVGEAVSAKIVHETCVQFSLNSVVSDDCTCVVTNDVNVNDFCDVPVAVVVDFSLVVPPSVNALLFLGTTEALPVVAVHFAVLLLLGIFVSDVRNCIDSIKPSVDVMRVESGIL